MRKMSFLLAALFLVFAAVATAVPVAPAHAQDQVQLQAAQAQPMTKAEFLGSLEARPVCNILCTIGFKCCIVRGQATCVPIEQVCHP